MTKMVRVPLKYNIQSPCSMKPTPSALQGAKLLGIECGASKSVAIFTDSDGQGVDRLEGTDPANLRLLDGKGLDSLLRRIGGRFPNPDAIGIGMAGVMDRGDRERVLAAAGRIWPGIPCWTGNDLETALAAAGDEPTDGKMARVIVISGTGASCYGRKSDGAEVLTGGWGHLLGDHGSGYGIALRACQAVFLELDETGRWPVLGERILGLLQLNSPAELSGWLGTVNKAGIAALAVEVFAAAAVGDKLAKGILKEAVGLIARTAIACARQVADTGTPVAFVLTGSVLVKQRGFASQVERRLIAGLPRATVRVLSREAAWGAVAMARLLQPSMPAKSKTGRGAKKAVSPPPEAEWIPVSRGLSPTESRNPRSNLLDRMSVPASIRLMLEEDAEIPVALMREHRKIHRAIQFIVKAFTSGGRLFYVGAGTSGRLGVLDAYECPPTFNVPPGMVQAILAGSDQALKGAMEDAEDDIAGGTEAVRSRGITKQDVVIGIAASGRTPFVWGALNAARDRGAVTILVCFNPNLTYPAGIRPDLVITPRIGPEVLTGSTRLKAGTATKLLLNMFTTLSMVRIGKVVENLMVDVQPTNAKLRLRAIRIVRELAGVTAGVAEDELKRNDWAVKTTLSRLRGGSA